ncbi:MAG: 2-succinyl-6-hydroxy-2,4-cyclohexadiene-1-carboxylate synthase [Melioribacteraceae bacterium]|nr:2-succinyl-6-hydroxy-2,4-cyclohexadiene-1-carboxylate synthase [Melioribacteraceae bacterium]
MKIPIDNIHIYCSFHPENLDNLKIPVLFLHGFTGSGNDWNEIIRMSGSNFYPVAIDLIGHGKSSAPADLKYYSADSISDQIKKVFDHLGFSKAVLCGYSLGGRASLSFYNKYPACVSGLVLESSTAGIPDSADRKQRMESDRNLSALISEVGLEQFFDQWYDQQLFASLKFKLSEKFSEFKKTRTEYNNITGLVNILKGFGTGSMPDYWSILKNIDIPVLLICGELDKKYCSINEEMHRLVKNSSLKIIKNSGHNTHLENPSEFVSLINNFLRNYFT